MQARSPWKSDIQKGIIEMVRHDVVVSACVKRLANWCLSNGIKFQEGNSQISGELENALSPHYISYLRAAIEIMHVCGFVPWYVCSKNGISVPVVLPLGSFTWAVEPVDSMQFDQRHGSSLSNYKLNSSLNNDSSDEALQNRDRTTKRRKTAVYRYVVTMTHSDLREQDIHILEYVPPSPVSRHGLGVISPVIDLYSRYTLTQKCNEMLGQAASYNNQRHVILTEQLDLKEQTTSGIQLLDEFRRYAISGTHPTSSTSVIQRLRARDATPLQSVTEATHRWIRDSFETEESVKTHILPPNVNAQELQNITIDDHIKNCMREFNESVHVYFDLPCAFASSHTQDRTENTEYMLNEEQYTNIRTLCDFLQNVAETAYNFIFKTENCVVQLRAKPRLSLKCADDVKKLVECGVFTQRDLMKLRQMFLQG